MLGTADGALDPWRPSAHGLRLLCSLDEGALTPQSRNGAIPSPDSVSLHSDYVTQRTLTAN